MNLQQEVNELLKDCKQTKLPIDVELIANRLGIEVDQRDFEHEGYDNVALFFTIANGKGKVWLNCVLPNHQVREYLALAICHYLTHQEKDFYTYIGRIWERGCQRFNTLAMPLLIPEPLIKEVHEKLLFCHIGILADAANVSPSLMRVRLDQLGLSWFI